VSLAPLRPESDRAAALAHRPRLVLGLGNPLMGDDGVGWHVVECLRQHPRLPSDVDLAWGGTDLLRCAALLRGRRAVVIVDAMAWVEGEVVPIPPWDDAAANAIGDDGAPRGAHTLAVPEALALLRCEDPGLEAVELRLLGVGVGRVEAGPHLSPALQGRLLAVAEQVLATLEEPLPA
jgi:hydrogenase maturation protease